MTVAWQRVEELLKRFQVGIEPTTSVTPVGQVVISVTHHLLHSKPLFISYMPFKSVTIIASNIGPARLCLHESLFGEAENRSTREKKSLEVWLGSNEILLTQCCRGGTGGSWSLRPPDFPGSTARGFHQRFTGPVINLVTSVQAVLKCSEHIILVVIINAIRTQL